MPTIPIAKNVSWILIFVSDLKIIAVFGVKVSWKMIFIESFAIIRVKHMTPFNVQSRFINLIENEIVLFFFCCFWLLWHTAIRHFKLWNLPSHHEPLFFHTQSVFSTGICCVCESKWHYEYSVALLCYALRSYVNANEMPRGEFLMLLWKRQNLVYRQRVLGDPSGPYWIIPKMFTIFQTVFRTFDLSMCNNID